MIVVIGVLLLVAYWVTGICVCRLFCWLTDRSPEWRDGPNSPRKQPYSLALMALFLWPVLLAMYVLPWLLVIATKNLLRRVGKAAGANRCPKAAS